MFVLQENNKTDEVDVDIDELLDMDDDNQRRIHLQVSSRQFEDGESVHEWNISKSSISF